MIVIIIIMIIIIITIIIIIIMITIIRAEDSPSIHFGGNPPWDDLEDLATEQDEEPVHCQVDDLFLLAGIEKSIGQPSID